MPDCVFGHIVFLISVSLDVTEAVIGGSVVLPCSKHHLKPQDIEVFWRHNDSKIVFDIIKGKNLDTHDQRYKNRVELFTSKNLRRNYSIKLTDLNHADETVDVEKSGPVLSVYIVVPVLVLLFALIANQIIFYLGIKRAQAASFASVSNEEQTTVP
uniref:Immunoglobulin V-set domain-containing protein n=1 Tax=Sinocyclocheilus rhinocerous TaxID=307959 RepID=A0A673K4G5_9TELE